MEVLNIQFSDTTTCVQAVLPVVCDRLDIRLVTDLALPAFSLAPFQIVGFLVNYFRTNPTYHRLRGRGTTVTMTSKVNGTMELPTPCKSETPKTWKPKLDRMITS